MAAAGVWVVRCICRTWTPCFFISWLQELSRTPGPRLLTGRDSTTNPGLTVWGIIRKFGRNFGVVGLWLCECLVIVLVRRVTPRPRGWRWCVKRVAPRRHRGGWARASFNSSWRCKVGFDSYIFRGVWRLPSEKNLWDSGLYLPRIVHGVVFWPRAASVWCTEWWANLRVYLRTDQRLFLLFVSVFLLYNGEIDRWRGKWFKFPIIFSMFL